MTKEDPTQDISDFLDAYREFGENIEGLKIHRIVAPCDGCSKKIRVPFNLEKFLNTGKLTVRCPHCSTRITWTVSRTHS